MLINLSIEAPTSSYFYVHGNSFSNVHFILPSHQHKPKKKLRHKVIAHRVTVWILDTNILCNAGIGTSTI